MAVRLFVAIEIHDNIRKKITELQEKLKKVDADIVWVAPENLHITLKFIGSLDEQKIDSVYNRIKNSTEHTQPFELQYKGVGSFPSQNNPRVIFVQAIDENNVLADVYEKLNGQLETLGVKSEDRRYSAHVTLGRVKTRRNRKTLIDFLSSYDGFNFGVQHITQVVLMKSDLTQKGPRYTKLRGVDLI